MLIAHWRRRSRKLRDWRSVLERAMDVLREYFCVPCASGATPGSSASLSYRKSNRLSAKADDGRRTLRRRILDYAQAAAIASLQVRGK